MRMRVALVYQPPSKQAELYSSSKPLQAKSGAITLYLTPSGSSLPTAASKSRCKSKSKPRLTRAASLRKRKTPRSSREGEGVERAARLGPLQPKHRTPTGHFKILPAPCPPRLPLFTKLKTDDEMPIRREIHLSSFALGGVGSADVSRAPHHLERDKETF